MSNSIKDALKKLCLKMTGKKSNKESIQDVIDDITKDYDGVSADYVEQRINERLVSVYTYKGSVQTYDDLPTQNLNVGDVYNVLDTGKNYAWADTEWDELGGHIALYTDNIQALTTKQINSLKCGDVVIKLTNNQQHCYIVTYKENNVGICMSYFDASVVETVSYDYVGTDWVYNSKDSTAIQPKLTAGEGITISEENVISSSATSSPKYIHYIRLYCYRNYAINDYDLSFIIISDRDSAYDKLSLFAYFKDVIGYQKYINCSGMYSTATQKIIIAVIQLNGFNGYTVTGFPPEGSTHTDINIGAYNDTNLTIADNFYGI